MPKRRNKRRWRVGNFVIVQREVPTLGEGDWRLGDEKVRSLVKSGKIGTIPCYEVSSLDGAWMTRFMPGSMMETMVSSVLGGDDGDEWLELVLTNLMQVSAIPNGYYHQGVFLLTAAYYRPELISGGIFSGERRRFLKDAKKLRDDFLSWYRETETQRAVLYEESEEDEKRDSYRLDAEKILEGRE